MFIQIEDPSDLPRPPEEVQLRRLDVQPYPDGRRLRVTLELTPFEQPPDISITVRDEAGVEAADVHIVATNQRQLELTIHLRGVEPHGRFTLDAALLYEDLGQVNQLQRTIELPVGSHDDQT